MPYQPTDELHIEHDGPVAIVTMNNPDMRNAFVDALHVAMREVWGHLALDRSVRTVVLTPIYSRYNPFYSLDATGRWVTQNTCKVLLLPLNRQSHLCAFQGNRLVIGHASGQLTIFEFNSDTS